MKTITGIWHCLGLWIRSLLAMRKFSHLMRSRSWLVTNEKHCKPPLDNSEFEKEWKQATQLIIPQIEKEQQEQTQGQMSQAALSEELAKEVSFDDIASILSISIKKDKAPKLITFCAML